MNELVSVLIPVYNTEKYIGACLESVLAQTYKNIEIVIIDDGSTDQTFDICKEYMQKNDCIRLIHQDNGGISSARNHALEEARGELIAWIDADDCVRSEYIETLYKMLTESDADIAVVGYERFENELPTVADTDFSYRICDKYFPLEQMTFDYFWLVQWGKLIRKRFYNGIRYPLGKTHEDEFLAYRLYYQTSRVAFSKCKLYLYRKNIHSIMGRKYNASRLAVLEALQQRVSFYEDHDEEKLACMTIKKLLGMYRNHYFLVKENLGDQVLMNELYDQYMMILRKNKKRCGITLFTHPELYIIPYQQYSKLLQLHAKIKHKLGFIYW